MAAARPEEGLEARRRREFRRMVAVSAAVHAGALGLAVSSPAPRAVAPPNVISVELVADPSRSAPAARPSPPKPKPRVQRKTVLPAKPSEPRPKPKPAEPKRQEEVFLDPPPKEEKSLDDLLAEMREERGEAPPAEAAPTPTPTQTATATPGGSAGVGRPVSPEVLDWVRRAKIAVRRAWVVPPGFRMEPLETHVVVTLDASGNVVGTPEIARRSGNPWYDEGVVRGIEKASPLPPPPEPGEWDFVFVPEDAY